MELTLAGESVYVGTAGKEIDSTAETVLFVHGVGQDHTVWVLPTRYFASHHRNVLAVDLPGHGRSGGAPLRSVAEMADWVVTVLDTVGVQSAALVGHSMGSLVSLDAAARYAQRVRALAMVCVSFPLAVTAPLLESARAGSHDAIDMLTYWGLSNPARLGGSPTPGTWMAGASARLLETARAGVIETDLRACDSYTAGADRAQHLQCPARLILGEKDRMTPVRGATAIREAIPDQETVILSGAGHALLLERSDQVLDELIRVV
ncbi:MAG: alpha/beta fold hydrolase [Acidimicrobiia bacterium]